jgi:3' terminal RNA ribose 2'-O-methyltransferase Hen1
VLIPVLDAQKHYWVGDDEVEKLLARGEGWLPNHPDRELIVNRYLKYQRPLARAALEQLLADEEPAVDADAAEREAEEEAVEEPLCLNEKRHDAVVAAVRASGATRVLDLGCGSGKLLRALLDEPSPEKIVGVDISYAALETAKSRLRLDRLAPRQRAQIELFQTALTYRDRRLAGFDAAAVVEVIEHFDEPRLRGRGRTHCRRARVRRAVCSGSTAASPSSTRSRKSAGSRPATSSSAFSTGSSATTSSTTATSSLRTPG